LPLHVQRIGCETYKSQTIYLTTNNFSKTKSLGIVYAPRVNFNIKNSATNSAKYNNENIPCQPSAAEAVWHSERPAVADPSSTSLMWFQQLIIVSDAAPYTQSSSPSCSTTSELPHWIPDVSRDDHSEPHQQHVVVEFPIIHVCLNCEKPCSVRMNI